MSFEWYVSWIWKSKFSMDLTGLSQQFSWKCVFKYLFPLSREPVKSFLLNSSAVFFRVSKPFIAADILSSRPGEHFLWDGPMLLRIHHNLLLESGWQWIESWLLFVKSNRIALFRCDYGMSNPLLFTTFKFDFSCAICNILKKCTW